MDGAAQLEVAKVEANVVGRTLISEANAGVLNCECEGEVIGAVGRRGPGAEKLGKGSDGEQNGY